tara:strand:- start:951 stop:1271 length:321 start_codon:yes stop_codon:yes gene_type:complete
MIRHLLLISYLIFLNGCVQSTAMVGPAVTFVSTGNFAQAGFSIGANNAVKKETGYTTTELITKKINEHNLISNEDNSIEDDLYILLNTNIKKTRKILLNDSPTNLN